MYGGKQTLYDVLELRRNANERDVEGAYERAKSDMAKGRAKSDPRHVALVQQAYEVLNDPQRRADYDKSLREAKFFGEEQMVPPRVKWAAVGGGIVLAAIALYLLFRPSGPPVPRQSEVLAAAQLAAGRLESLDPSGRATVIGLASAIQPAVMVSTCHGIHGGGAQLIVREETRSVPVSVAIADGELDLCRLTALDAGTKPLRVHPEMPRPGDKVYTLTMNAAGKLVIADGKVKEIVSSPRGNVIEITIPIAAHSTGGPLLDAQGRVVGITIAPHDYGAGRHIALPASWINTARSRAAGQPAEPAAPPAKKKR